MRAAFIRALEQIATRDPRVVLLTADLGFGVVDRFADQHPHQFVNVGVAEQNMVGIATGLAEAGYIPFVYSIATFASLRAYEFIRNGPILHRLPVRIVGVGGGMDYAHQGLTHYALEDVAVMRAQPGMTVIVPADAAQACAALDTTWERAGPVYYRLGKDERPPVPGLEGTFGIDTVGTVRRGEHILLIVAGPIAHEVIAAADLLADDAISCEIVVAACLNPAPAAALEAALRRFSIAVTVEAHYTVGGLGSLVAEVIATRGIACRLTRLGVTATPPRETGSSDYVHRRHGLTPAQLRESILTTL